MTAAAGTYWVAGYALATQSRFPPVRLKGDYATYGKILDALEKRAWRHIPTTGSLQSVDVRKTQTGDQVQMRLRAALAVVPDDIDVCVVDLRPPVLARGIADVYPNTLRRVGDSLYRQLSAGGLKAHLLVVVPVLDEKDEVHVKSLWELTQGEQTPVTVVGADGQVWSRLFATPNVSALAEAFGDPTAEAMEALEEKMIRRLGFFPRLDELGEIDNYTRYFYDGRYCSNELAVLFGEKLRTLIKPDDAVAVVYDEGPSGWIAAPLEEAVGKLNRDDPDLNLHVVPLAALDTTTVDGEELRTVIAVVPMVDAGRTLDGLISACRTWAKAAEIHAVSVLRMTTSGNRPKSETLALGGKEVLLHYFKSDDQETVSRDDVFAPDLTYYQADQNSSERFLPFTSADFWSLAQEAKFIPERDAPKHRKPLRRVPDLLAFLDNNAAWVAHKIETAVQLRVGKPITRVSLALVAEEQAATRLSHVLSTMLGNQPLHIPREDIATWNHRSLAGREALKRWKHSPGGWVEQAQTAAKDVVILDEFAYGAGTLSNMASLLQALGLQVRLVLALAAFSREAFESELSQFNHLALYTTEWGRKQSLPRVEGEHAPTA